MHRQSFLIPVWVTAFSLFFCVGPISIWEGWELDRGFVGRSCWFCGVNCGVDLAFRPEHLDIAGKVFVAIGDHLLSFLLWEP